VLTVTIVLCSWCHSPRPIRVDGAEKIPPGLHAAQVQVSHGICSICEIKVDAEMKKGGTTSDVTSVRDNATGEKFGC
jgi:hypothetical protein